MKNSPAGQDLLPLTPPVFHILLALADRERHGYGIMQEIGARTGGALRIGPGTLYGSIKRMLADGLIEESDERLHTPGAGKAWQESYYFNWSDPAHDVFGLAAYKDGLWVAKSAPLDAMQGDASVSLFAKWQEDFAANWPAFKVYLPFVGLCWLLFQFSQSRAAWALVIFSLTVVALLLTAVLGGGKVSLGLAVERRRDVVVLQGHGLRPAVHDRACVYAIAELAHAEPSELVARAYGSAELAFGPEYIIPKPFDPRLIVKIAPAVAALKI